MISLLSFLDFFYNKLQIFPKDNLIIKSDPELKIFIFIGPQGKFFLSYVTVLKVKKALLKKNKSIYKFFNSIFSQKLKSILFYFSKILIMKGVGFRFEFKYTKLQKIKYLKMKLGYCFPLMVKIPNSIFLSSPKNTRLIIKGSNPLLVHKFFLFLKKFRIPDNYKGKGILSRREKLKKKPVIKQNTK